RQAATASAIRPLSSTVIPIATNQPKNAAPTFAPPNRCRTSAGTAVIGPVAGSAAGVSCLSTVAMRAVFPVPDAGKRRHGTMDAGTYEEETLICELVRRQDVHRAVADPQLLRHRPHRPRQ